MPEWYVYTFIACLVALYMIYMIVHIIICNSALGSVAGFNILVTILTSMNEVND